jgi:hypothetical protein
MKWLAKKGDILKQNGDPKAAVWLCIYLLQTVTGSTVTLGLGSDDKNAMISAAR